MSADINDQTSNDSLLVNEELYRIFVTQSSEAVWRFELEEPVAVNLSPDEQIEKFYNCGYLAECNPAMARMYGFTRAEEIVGARLGDFLVREDPSNIEYLRAFIAADYRLENAESHEVDRAGNPKFFLNNLIGVVEDGMLKRAWGTQRDVTEQREIEQSKAHLAAIVESSDDAIISKDLRGRITSWNKGAEKTFGYAAEEAIGKPITIIIPEHLLSEEADILARVKKGLKVQHYETIRQRKDGSFISIALTVSPIKNEAGEIVGASKIARDITESRRAEESLRESQAMLALSMQSSRMGFWSRDLKTETVWWSEELEEIFGLDKGAFRGTEKDFFDFVHEDDREEVYNEIRQAVEEKREYTIEFRFRRTDGTLRWMEGRGRAFYSEKGEPIRLYGIGIDITERKIAEQKIRESEEKFAKAFNSSPLVLTITSLKTGKLIEVNETFVRLTGYTRAESIGRTTEELGLWANSEDRAEELAQVATKGEIRDLEYVFRLRDGRRIVGLLSAELLELRGEPCALTVIQDITERKKAEEISARYRVLSQRARDVILFVRPDGRILDANRMAVETYGYTTDELLKMSLRDLRAPETLDSLNLQLDKANEGGIQFETEHVRRNGARFPVEVASVGADIGGERLIISIIRDITERRKSEEVVRRSIKQLALVTDIAPVYIAHCSRDLRFKFVNKAYSERFGLMPADCIGKKIVDIIGEAAFEGIAEHIATVLSGQTVEFETMLDYPKIGKRFMHTSYAPEIDEKGEVIGFVAAITDISEHRLMEEAVRESEEQLRQMADAMPQVVWISDAKGVVHYYNNRVSEFFGIEEKPEGTWDWQPGIYEEDLPATVREWQKAARAKSVYTKEHRIKMADGSYRWHLSRAVPALDANGEIVKWYGTATDINDIKQAEEALRESEKRFRTLTNNAPVMVWLSGADKLVTYFNQTWLDFTGRTLEEELEEGWRTSVHPDDFKHCYETYSKSFDAREEFEMEYRLRRFDGEYRWVLVKGVPLFTHNGTFLGYIGSCIDVTERLEAQAALLKAERRASEEYLELLSRIVPLAQILGTARDLVSIYRALHEFIRRSMPCTAFFVSFYDAARNLRTAAYAWGEEGEVDVSLLPPMTLTRDGGPNSQAIFEKRSVAVNRYWELIKQRPHVVLQEDGRDPNSSLVVPMTVMNRTTGTLEVQAYEENAFTKEHVIALEMVANLAAVAIENVRLLQVEAEARETAEAANRAKDEFLSVLSHELRTPLNSMLGWTRMLGAGMLDEDKTKKAIEVIERNTLLQNNLIEDLLDVSRIISGKMRIEKESLDLVKVFGDAIDNLRLVAAQKRIEFDARAGAESLIVDGDATRLQQIIGNLVQNAIKFTAEGGRVGVTLERRADSARIVVEDNGIGISDELLPYIFERFRQADSSTKRAFSGLGLGLTIVHNLVELHGGTIEAESPGEGRGAVFTVEIPLTKEFVDKAAADQRSRVSSNGDAVLAGARILLVDDDADSLIPLQLFLEKEKAEVVTAESVGEALGRLSERNFHIMITDIGMPLADGYDLIAKVRQLQTEQNAFITAIALTAYASSDDRRRALASGFQDHFAKPVDYDELLTVIRRFYEKVK